MNGIPVDLVFAAVAIGITAPIALLQDWPSGARPWVVLATAALALLARRATASAVWVGVMALAFSVPLHTAILVTLVVALPAAVAGIVRRVSLGRVLLEFLAMMTAVLTAVAIAGPTAERSMPAVILGATMGALGWTGVQLLAGRYCGLTLRSYRWVVPNPKREVGESVLLATTAASLGYLVGLAGTGSGGSAPTLNPWVVVPTALLGLAAIIAVEVGRHMMYRFKDEAIEARLREVELGRLADRGHLERVVAHVLHLAPRRALDVREINSTVEAIVWGERYEFADSQAARIAQIADVYDTMTTFRPGRMLWSPHLAHEELRDIFITPFDTEIIAQLYATEEVQASPVDFSDPGALVGT